MYNRWNPARTGNEDATPLDTVHNELDKILQDVFGTFIPMRVTSVKNSSGLQDSTILRPNLDMSMSEKEYTITVEIPGVDPDAVELKIDDNNLILSGEKKQETSEEKTAFYRMERSYGSFERVIALPEDADEDNIAASHKHGVLTITIPRKTKEEPTAKKITITKEDQ